MDSQKLRAEIIALLALNQQKVSYEALSAIVGWTAQTVMGDLNKTRNNRWIVNAGNHLPTGYPSDLQPEPFQKIKNTITERAILVDWLKQQQLVNYSTLKGYLDQL